MNILMVDDERPFTEQAKIFLEKIDDGFNIETAISAAEGLKKLDEEDYDVVVSDYMMPEMDGLELLKTIREERESDIPFIVFTGKGREEVAIQALNLGADRYLQKGGSPKSQYDVLADAIKQEVKHHRTKKQNISLSRDLKEIFASISHPIFLLDKNHKILRVNEEAEAFFGKGEESLLGEFCHTIAHNQDEPIENCPLEKSLVTKQVEELEFYSEELDKYFIARTNPIFGDDGNIEKVVHQEIDVTDIKKKNIELERTKNLFDAVFNDPNLFIGILDKSGNLIKANPNSLDLIGCSMDELKGKPFFETPWWSHSKELQEKLKEGIKRCVEGEFIRFKATHHGDDGEKVKVDFSLRPVYGENGDVVRLLAEGKNITDL